MMAHGGKCGSHDQGCELMVRAAISHRLNILILIETNALWKCIIFKDLKMGFSYGLYDSPLLRKTKV